MFAQYLRRKHQVWQTRHACKGAMAACPLPPACNATKGRVPSACFQPHTWTGWTRGGACPSLVVDPLRPLRSIDPTGRGSPETAGFGNRLGWLLSASAVAEVLNRSLYTIWADRTARQDPAVPKGYSLAEVEDAIHLPSRLRFVSPQSGGCRAMQEADIIPSVPGSMPDFYYVPEAFWQMWTHWQTRFVPQCVSRAEFLQAYARVQAQLRPKFDLQNPRPRSYLALHWRRRGTPFPGERLLRGTEEVVAAISSATNLPWVVFTENATHEQEIRHVLANVLRVPVLARGPPQSAEAPAPWSLERLLLRDYFALSDASGIIVDTGKQATTMAWVDSSMSTVAAVHGGTPLIFPVPSSARSNVQSWKRSVRSAGSSLGSLEKMFFSDQVDDFVRALHGIGCDGRERRGPPFCVYAT